MCCDTGLHSFLLYAKPHGTNFPSPPDSLIVWGRGRRARDFALPQPSGFVRLCRPHPALRTRPPLPQQKALPEEGVNPDTRTVVRTRTAPTSRLPKTVHRLGGREYPAQSFRSEERRVGKE